MLGPDGGGIDEELKPSVMLRNAVRRYTARPTLLSCFWNYSRRHETCTLRRARRHGNPARAPRWRRLLVRAGDGPPLHSNCSGLSRLLCHRGAVPKAESRTRAGEPPDVARPARDSARRIRVASRSAAVAVGRCGIRSHEPSFIIGTGATLRECCRLLAAERARRASVGVVDR